MKRRFGAALAITSCFAFSHADITTLWQRQFHASGSEEFTHVAMDDAGDVFLLGHTFNGVDDDAIVAKYGAGGGLHWSTKFSGTGNQEPEGIGVTRDGQSLFLIYDQTPTQVNIKQMNPASGQSLTTIKFNAVAGHEVKGSFLIVQDSTSRVLFGVKSTKAGIPSQFWIRSYDLNSVFKGGTNFDGATEDTDVMDTAVRPGGGFFALIGDPGAVLPNSTVVAFDPVAAIVGDIEGTEATCIGTSDFGGGTLVLAGQTGVNQVQIQRYKSSDLSLQKTKTDTFSGATKVRFSHVSVGQDGAAYPMGYEQVSGYGKEWILLRYRYSDLNRDWRTARPGTATDDFYRSGATDAWGNLAVLGVRSGLTNDQLFVQVYDGISGSRLGQTAITNGVGLNNLFAIAVNASNVFASAGTISGGEHSEALAILTGQDGLRRISVPLASYPGGTVIPCTVAMYGATTGGRQIDLTSNNPVAPVPAHVWVLANQTNAGFNITTQTTTTDETVILNATFQGATRTTTFFVLAPRPLSVAFMPDAVIGGQNGSGSVALTGRAPLGGLKVNLSSDGPEAVVPASVTVAAGTTIKNFVATTTTAVVPTVRTISATANGVTKVGTLTINP